MEVFRDSVARLVIAGDNIGSAWMVTSSIVCTANHCVSHCELQTEVDLKFPSCSISGTIVEKDMDLDIALIEVDPESHQLVPLQLIARPITLDASIQWQLHGSPVQDAEYHDGGLTLHGHISNARSGSAAKPLMQLFCEQGLTQPNQTDNAPAQSPFGGVSGCPVVVSPRDSDKANYVIGVAVHHHKAQDNILYCTPIDEVVSRYGIRLQESQLISWDAIRRVLIIGRDVHGFRTNLDEYLLKSLWQEGLTGLWCNLHPDESLILTSGIERIVVQSPFSTARPTTDLHFSSAGAWQSRCEICVTDWVPVEDSTVKTTLGKYNFVELMDERLPLGGRHFDDLDDLANYLRYLCNDWALKRLRGRISETFDNPVGELKYNIAPDLVIAMRNLWNEWLKVLKNNPATLHHFFGLMLSDDGDVLMAESAAGTGPETIDRCVLRATIFALLLCIALPAQLQSPRGKSPGNLGQDEMSGHSSGIQTMSGLTLKMADRSHKWKTLFVMLPQLPMPWIECRVGEARFDKEVNESGTSFNQEPASSLVLPGDIELMEAISTGLDSLKSMLKKRYSEFLMAQEQYVAEAKDVTV